MADLEEDGTLSRGSAAWFGFGAFGGQERQWRVKKYHGQRHALLADR